MRRQVTKRNGRVVTERTGSGNSSEPYTLRDGWLQRQACRSMKIDRQRSDGKLDSCMDGSNSLPKSPLRLPSLGLVRSCSCSSSSSSSSSFFFSFAANCCCQNAFVPLEHNYCIKAQTGAYCGYAAPSFPRSSNVSLNGPNRHPALG